jgi:hypothetical protein
MKKTITILLIAVTMTVSCTRNTSGIDISGYTATDALGNSIGTTDASDWTVNESWSNEEENVFSGIPTGDLTSTNAGTVSIYPAYPNPCQNMYYITVTATTSCNMRFVIVTESLSILQSGTVELDPGTSTYSIYRDSPIPDGLYRMYYSFEAQSMPMFHKGHGDIMMQ